MKKVALKIENPSELEKSTLELLFRLYFDQKSQVSGYDVTYDDFDTIRIVIDDRSDFWHDIYQVTRSNMYIQDIKNILTANHIPEKFINSEYSILCEYDYFTIEPDYKANREIAKYTITFPFPNFIDSKAVKDVMYAIQSANAVGIIDKDHINDLINTLINNIMCGMYSTFIPNS